MVALPIFPGSPLWRFMRRLFAIAFGLDWVGPGRASSRDGGPSDAIIQEARDERPLTALEDDLSLATWEDAEWQ